MNNKKLVGVLFFILLSHYGLQAMEPLSSLSISIQSIEPLLRTDAEIIAVAEKLPKELKKRLFQKGKYISKDGIKKLVNGKISPGIDPKSILAYVHNLRNHKSTFKALLLNAIRRRDIVEVTFLLQIVLGVIDINLLRDMPFNQTIIATQVMDCAYTNYYLRHYKFMPKPLKENLIIARLLLQYGANPLLTDERGESAVSLAQKFGEVEMLELFKQFGWIKSTEFDEMPEEEKRNYFIEKEQRENELLDEELL